MTSRTLSFLVGALPFALFGFAALSGDSMSEVPDDTLTPGVVASTDINEVCGHVHGVSYSKAHRHTTAAMKAAVRREYGQRRCGEIDHRLELSLGGADSLGNLWCQPLQAKWNFRDKDRLEAWAWRAVCVRHAMALEDAQKLFLAPADWRRSYCHAYPNDRRCK